MKLTVLLLSLCALPLFASAAEVPLDGPPPAADAPAQVVESTDQSWNWHVQNTDIVQGDSGLHQPYAGPNSLPSSQVRATETLDVYLGARLWRGAEFHIDGLAWQGYGIGNALGVEDFPSGEAFRLGVKDPHAVMARAFIRQTIGLGGEEESVEDDQLALAGKRDISRVTLTLGKISVKDIFDNNTYANDPRTQFMGWGLMANEAWDYPADSLGYITGFAAELNQADWTLRTGVFQVPKVSNGEWQNEKMLAAWSSVVEFERRWTLDKHPGAARLLGYFTRANMGGYQLATDTAGASGASADIAATRDWRYKYGVCLNAEQEVADNIGVFTRMGWSDGHTEAWMFSDVDDAISAGVSVKGKLWGRDDDTFGLAGVLSMASPEHQKFLAAGGTGILAGDGALVYAPEEVMETYYDFAIWKKYIHGTLDYQCIANPAFNRDRGPVSVFGARVHCEF